MNMRVPIAAMLLLWGCLVHGHSPAMAEEDLGPDEPAATTPLLGGFLHETRVVYPLVHQGWTARGEQRYDDPALGVSIRYQHPDRPGHWIDVFFYPAGPLAMDRFKEAMGHERTQLQSAVRPDGYSEMVVGEIRPFDSERHGARRPVPGFSLDLRSVLRGQPLNSAMTLQLVDLYFVKGRMSVGETDLSREAVHEQLRGFMAALASDLTIVSSGECWRPLGPQGDRAKHPGVDAKVKPNAAETAGADAHLPGIQGCIAPEDLDQPMQEGRRELRLEYRAPRQPGQGDVFLG